MGENIEASTPILPGTATTVESYSFETLSTVKELIYTWTIKNLSHTYKETGECIESPLIETGFDDNMWHWGLRFYPNGVQETCQGFPSLILEQTTGATKRDQKVYLKLGIVDKSNEEHVRYQDFFTFSSATINDVSVLNFATKNNISDWLINQDLKIVCKMYLSVGCNNSTVNSEPVSKAKDTMSAEERSAEFDDFQTLLDSEKFSDVKLSVGNKPFFAHKNILAARSKVFAVMFEQEAMQCNGVVVTIDDVRDEVMEEALRFIYTGKVKDIESNTGELLSAADKYELKGLKRMCEEVLIGKLNKDSLKDILTLVDKCNVEKLRDATIDFITVHASELSSVDSFKAAIKKLSPSLLSVVVEALMLKI